MQEMKIQVNFPEYNRGVYEEKEISYDSDCNNSYLWLHNLCCQFFKESASRKSESQQAPFKQEKTEEQNEDVKENQNKNQHVSDNDEDIEEDGEGKSTEDTTENLDNEMEIPEEWNE